MIKKKIVTILFLLTPVFLIFGQQLRMELGDKYFDQYAYKKAIRLYEEAEDKGYTNWIVYAKLGDCYYYTSKPNKAIENYRKAIELNPQINEIYFLRFALSLQSVGEDKEALIQFTKYHGATDPISLRSRLSDSIEIVNIPINTEYSDFGSFILKDTFYFASSRRNPHNPKRKNKRLYKWNEQPYLDIYSTAIIKTDDSISFKVSSKDSTKFEINNVDINTMAHEASPAITNDGQTMYFSGGRTKNGKLIYNKNGANNLKLYRASRSNGNWKITKADSMAFDFLDHEEYSFSNPALDPYNKRLFFVSCAPFREAKGHTDIYYMDILEDGTFGKIINLDVVNTSGRESFPFISENGDLYFSSDGIHDGKISLGLLDLYKVENIDKVIRENKVDSIVHLPYPINSAKDDFAFYIEPKTKHNQKYANAFFSSNRDHPEANGDDDIYKFKIKLKKPLNILVLDSMSNLPLSNAKFDIIDEEGKVTSTVEVDSTGSAQINIDTDEVLKFRGYAYRYFDDLKSFDTSMNIETVILKLQPYPCTIAINHIEFDLDSDKIRKDEEPSFIPVLDLLLTNPELKIRIESHTDSHGPWDYNLDLSERRAKATKLYLLENGVNEEQIVSVKGFGEKCLVYSDEEIAAFPNDQQASKHEMNRRSIFILDGCEDEESCIDDITDN